MGIRVANIARLLSSAVEAEFFKVVACESYATALGQASVVLVSASMASGIAVLARYTIFSRFALVTEMSNVVACESYATALKKVIAVLEPASMASRLAVLARFLSGVAKMRQGVASIIVSNTFIAASAGAAATSRQEREHRCVKNQF